VKSLLKEEATLGWMEELPEDVARERFGTRLAIAALGVVEKKEKIRVVHDASHKVHVNHRIKVRDQIRCPGAGDIRTILRERVSAGVKSFGIMGDVSKAHRRVKVREQDWGYQACQLEAGKVWINKVGAYGVTSAGYWWARFAAAWSDCATTWPVTGIHWISCCMSTTTSCWLATRWVSSCAAC
jgi:hypothetical protein